VINLLPRLASFAPERFAQVGGGDELNPKSLEGGGEVNPIATEVNEP
jgi:hypothetical protein